MTSQPSKDILFIDLNLENQLINLNTGIKEIKNFSTEELSPRQKVIKYVENIEEFYSLVDKFEIITQDSELKDFEYFKLCDTLNKVEKLCFDNIVPHWQYLIAPPIISKGQDKKFFENSNCKYYLKRHLQEAQKKENNYSYHLRESYRCLIHNPELRNTLNDPLIESYIKLITDIETHTKTHLLEKAINILDDLFQQKIDPPYDITN